MYRYAKKYSKKIMAVLSIVLMVIFVVQQATSVSSKNATNAVVGHIGDTDVLGSEVEQAKAEWALLGRETLVMASMPPRYPGMPPQMQPVPLIYTMGGDVLVGERVAQ